MSLIKKLAPSIPVARAALYGTPADYPEARAERYREVRDGP